MSVSIPQRTCEKCQEAFPETHDFFPKNKNSKGGMLSWCKECNRAYQRKWDRAHRPYYSGSRAPNPAYYEAKRTRTSKLCKVCGVIKPLADFGSDSRRLQGIDYRCKDCIRERARLRHSKNTAPSSNQKSPGYIYIVYSIGRYKIGLSTNPQRRIGEIQSPYPVELICIIQTDDMLSLERQLHNQFDHARKHGEWFELSDADLDKIKHMT